MTTTTPTTKPIPILRYRPQETGIHRWFGSREASVMDILWAAHGERTVKQVLAVLAGAGDTTAYTTTMTTMSRLVEKGILTRRRVGRGDSAYRYAPRCSQAEFIEIQERAIQGSLTSARGA